MSNKIVKFAEEHNLQYQKNYIYGVYNGYQVSVDFGSENTGVGVISFYVSLGERTNDFFNFIALSKKSLKITDYGMGIGVHCVFTHWAMGSSVKLVKNALDIVTQKLAELGVAGDLCPYCHQPMENPTAVCVGSYRFCAHEECFNQRLQSVVNVESEEDAKPNNYLRGAIGALIGSLVGGILFAVLFFVGFLAAVCSMVGAICASKLYNRFGGKKDKFKLVIVALCTLVVTVGSFFLCNVISVAMVLAEQNIDANAWVVMIELLQTDKETAAAFWGDFALAIVFYVAGIVYEISAMAKEQKKASANMRKMG